MGRHRSRLKILASILNVVNDNNGAKKTQIMYKAYLSYSLLIRYLNEMMEMKLLVCEEENCFKPTKKGREYLAKFSKYAVNKKKVNEKLTFVEKQRKTLENMVSNFSSSNTGSSN
jgi:predicted transcriptional regulator